MYYCLRRLSFLLPLSGPQIFFAVLLCLGATPVRAGESVIADRVLRFVNDEVITQGDVWDEMRSRYLLLRHRGAPLPETEEDLMRLQEEALKELTEQRLLAQEADRLGIQIDEARIRRQVQESIRERNLPPSLVQEAEEQQRRIREGRIYSVLRYYQEKWPEISPQQIQKEYNARLQEFLRPARVRALRIVIRPTAADDMLGLQRRMMAALQRVQEDRLPAVAESIDDTILSAIARSGEGRARMELLVQALTQALAAVPEEPPRQTAALAGQMKDLLEQYKQSQSRESVDQQLQAIREELLTISDVETRIHRFQALAREQSQGPLASQGGDMGWFEPDAEGEEVETFVLSQQVGSISEPTSLGQFRALLMLAEREEAGPRSLREVGAEIQVRLENQRIEMLRERLVAQLHRRGVVQDLELTPTFPSEWFVQDDAEDDG